MRHESEATKPVVFQADDDAPDGVEVLIPYRNPLALVSYYCGVFGLLPVVGFLLGPVAFVLGIMGIHASRKNPRARGVGHAIVGIILGFLASIVNWGVAVRIYNGTLFM